MQELHQGEWSESDFQQNNRLTKLSRAANKERNKAKIFTCPWIMAERKGRHRKIFLFPPSLLAWLNDCVSAAPFKSDYLTFRNEFTKETSAYHEAANGMPPRPPAPRSWHEQLEVCRAKGIFALHHTRQVLIGFHYTSSLLLSHTACSKVNDIIWKLW